MGNEMEIGEGFVNQLGQEQEVLIAHQNDFSTIIKAS